MAVPQGVRIGGRKKGTPNKLTQQLQEWFDGGMLGIGSKYDHPIVTLLKIANNDVSPIEHKDRDGNVAYESPSWSVRQKALADAAKLLQPIKVELTGADGEPLFDTTPALNVALNLINSLPTPLPPPSVDVTTLVEHVTDDTTPTGAVSTRTPEAVA